MRIRAIVRSFGYAFNGLLLFFMHERNGKIQLLAAVAAVMLSWQLDVSLHEWIGVMGCIAAVLSFEMMNSAIEKVCNMVQPEFHPAIKCIKDISAAAVLCVSIFSGIIGVVIFLPRILNVV